MAENAIDKAWIEAIVLGVVQSMDRLQKPPEVHTRLQDDLGFDTLDIVECIMDIEKAINARYNGGIYIPELQAEEVETVGDLIEAAKLAVERK